MKRLQANRNKLPNYSRVRLLTDDYLDQGVRQGDLGYIIEVYKDSYEVEFSDSQGITIALVAIPAEHLVRDEP